VAADVSQDRRVPDEDPGISLTVAHP
jgi:hypothetical protein